MPKIVTPLRVAIASSGRTQREIARKAGIDESKLSRIVNGRVHPADATQRRIARALGQSVTDLWPTDEPKAAA